MKSVAKIRDAKQALGMWKEKPITTRKKHCPKSADSTSTAAAAAAASPASPPRHISMAIDFNVQLMIPAKEEVYPDPTACFNTKEEEDENTELGYEEDEAAESLGMTTADFYAGPHFQGAHFSHNFQVNTQITFFHSFVH